MSSARCPPLAAAVFTSAVGSAGVSTGAASATGAGVSATGVGVAVAGAGVGAASATGVAGVVVVSAATAFVVII